MDDESLPQKIGKALPELDFAQLNTLLKYLREELGVVTESDLQYVERDDIQPLLTPIQTRRLLKACRGTESNGHMNTDSTGSSLELVTVTSSLLSSQSSTSPVLSASSPLDIQPQAGPSSWITRFVVPWEKMSPALSLAISMGKRADPRDRIAMVRTVVEAMQVHCPNPNRAACAEIAKAIVSKHPRTFGDITEEGELLGSGYHSLLEQLKRRVEHVNRNCDSHRIRQPKRTPNDDSNANRRVRSKVDSYGCINWQPKDLPEGETSDSLESKRVTLVELFGSMGPRAAELTEVDEFMRLTYIYQRYMINSCPPPPLHLLEEHWPFLFTKRGLCTHFLTLTGIDIDDRLGEALVTKGRRIVSFFQSQKLKWGNEIQALLKEMESATSERNQDLTAIAAVLLAMKYFHETEDSIFILSVATATKISIEAEKDLPATPRLIMLGRTLLSADQWMVSIEEKVAYTLEHQHSFAAAMAVYFGCFYIYNIEYEESACATLELIQRFFVRINPEEGSKCTAKVGTSRRTGAVVKRKTSAMNSRVTTFLRRLTEFEWKTSN
ncbi:uncharacterized protein LOC125900954 [Epinephelus fuscoguttatus]|uniref:uncharacterized protein LOC125900954 n=1 Tax=Epinephelus fuscoguttatus TaxID=293821 RepID=UPI0020D1D027|nr:uncharacterized protein LOC125900954 [Epinephelus fuscoguttatus]XP_049452238.1 uncharacterized protein LOC125900954 [Epinephelus fuscoguttatus]